MDEAKEFFNMDWEIVMLGIVATAAFFKVAVDFIKWVIKQFGIEFKADRERREEHELLVNTIAKVNELENNQKTVAENSKKYDKALKQDVENLTQAIDTLTKKVDDMAEKSDATDRANLKDKIAQRYRKYTVEKQWTKMEKESFNDLIRDYEVHGGKNSFVHTVCEPESFTWLVVDEDTDK